MGELTASLSESTIALAIAIFIVAAVESVAVLGLILPGTLMMSAVAFQAGQINMNVYLMLISGALGAVVGDSISYWLGKTQCQRIPRYWPFNRHPSWLERGQRFFDRHGGLSILIGRFIGPVRPLIPMIAGMMRMPQPRFLIVNVLSAIGWAPLYLLPGYCVGRNAHFSATASLWIASLLVVFLLSGFFLGWGNVRLAPESRAYRALERRMRVPSWRRKCWNFFCSPVWGFPLAACALVALALPGLLCWTLWVWQGLPDPLTIDTATRTLLYTLSQHPIVSSLAQGAALIADGPGLVILFVPWICWWLIRRYYAMALHWSIALLALPTFNWLMKQWLERPRPSTLLHSYSYPSAHTTGFALFCCLMAGALSSHLPPRLRSSCRWGTLTLMTLMGLSRLICDVHWLSDVIGGLLLAIVAYALLSISLHIFAKRELSWRYAWLPSLLIVVTLAVRIAWALN